MFMIIIVFLCFGLFIIGVGFVIGLGCGVVMGFVGWKACCVGCGVECIGCGVGVICGEIGCCNGCLGCG